MDRRVRTTAAAVALAAASFSAHAQMQGQFFVSGNAGMSYNYDSDIDKRTGAAGAVRAGYEWQSGAWPDDRFDFGVELGYADLGKAKANTVVYEGYYLGNVEAKYDVHPTGPTLGGNFRFRFNDHWYVFARAGYMHMQLKLNVSVPQYGPSAHVTRNQSTDGAYAGFGMGYDVNEHFGLGFGYDSYYGQGRYQGIKYSNSSGLLSGFAEYRF